MTKHLPRLLDSTLRDLGRLEPLSLSIELNLTPPSTAVMTLPPDAPSVQPGQFMELYTPQGSAGIFRVEQVEQNYPAPSRITLTHGLTTLSDSLIFSAEEITQPAAGFFRSLLSQQELWHPGMVSIPDDALITWRSEAASLLEALMALVEEFPAYCLTFDQTTVPWKVNLLPLPEECTTECRLTRNLRSLSIESDRSDLCTQLFLPGIAEPLTADTIDRWGTVSRSFSADAALTPEEVIVRGRQYLEQHKNPQTTITMDALELCAATGSALDRFQLGSLCRICLPESNTFMLHRIISMTYPDVYGTPECVRVILSSGIRNTSSVLAGLIVDSTRVKKSVVQQWHALSDQKDLIIAAEESITLLSKNITLHAEEILTLQAGVGDNLARITLLDGRIEAQANEIDLHANDILTLRAGVDDNAARITLANGEIAANAQKITANAEDIEANARSIQAHADEISLQARNTLTLQAGVDENKAAISLSNGKILELADAISLKADQASLDLANGRIDAQADRIALKADRIDLQGYVTASELAAESARINNFFSGSAVAAKLIVTNLTALSFTFAGNACTWTSTEVVTNVRVNETGAIAVRDADGVIIGTAVTGIRCTQDKEMIYYITWGTGGE